MRGARTALLVLAGAAALVLLGEADARCRRAHGLLPDARSAGGLPPGAAAAALGGFRLPALVALWLDCDRLWREQRWWALRARYELIVRLEPRIPAVWGYLADLMMMNLADRAPDPETRWVWTREGLEMLERGIAANPADGFLRIQQVVRLASNVARDPDLAARYEAWSGRPLLEAALGAARDLASLHPGDAEDAIRVPHVRKAFAYIAFRRAWTLAEKGLPAGEACARAAGEWREAAAGYRALGKPGKELADYASAFAALCDALPGVDVVDRNRLVRERLAPFKDYVEAHEVLEGL